MPHSQNNANNRAERLRRLREYLGVSRRSFCTKHKIAAGSMQNWEDARFGGLTEKGAQRLVEVFASENIHFTPEWLLFGIGSDPLVEKMSNQPISEITPSMSEETFIAEELKLFYRYYKNAMHLTITDKSMEPHYWMGDIVAGPNCFEPKKIINKDCLVQIPHHPILIRRIKKTNHEEHFNLATIHSDQTITHQNAPILSVAPIIWIRRKAL